MTLTSYARVWKWALAAILCLVAIAGVFAVQQQETSNQYWGTRAETTAGLAAVSSLAGRLPGAAMTVQLSSSQQGPSSGPMIIRTVSVRLTFARPDTLRPRVDEIVRRYQGYIDTLTIRTEIGLGRALSATLRVPADQLQSAVAELKALGDLVEESESSQDTTAGYTDLVARLSNARKTEQRLLALLTARTGKLGEVVQVEKELGEIRERIEGMEAQQRRTDRQVRFVAINLVISEKGAESFATMRTIQMALADGYHLAITNTAAVILAALRYGPSVIAYLLLLLPLIVLFYRRLRFSRHAGS